MGRSLIAVVVCLAIGASAAVAGPVVLTFEGLQNNEAVSEFYNGGLGGNGTGPGPSLGVSFSGNALAIIDADAGGSGNFGGEPSPDTVMYFLSGPAATLNVPAGFDKGFSFFYRAINQPGYVNVYDGLNATGNLLTTIVLALTPVNGAPDPTGPFSPFVPIGMSFVGIARSVDFGGTVNQIGFDDITFGSDKPGPQPQVMPEPLSILVWCTIGVVACCFRRPLHRLLRR